MSTSIPYSCVLLVAHRPAEAKDEVSYTAKCLSIEVPAVLERG
jgi:hypothetical protein